MKHRFQIFALPLVSLLLASVSCATETDAPDFDSIRSELAEPATVILKNGRRLHGHPMDVAGEQLRLGTAEGAGEVIYTLRFDEIRELRLPGESYKTVAMEWIQENRTDDALRLFALLFEQRSSLLPLLDAAESHFFIHYLRLVLRSGNPARAIAITERLKPQIDNPAAVRALDDAVLEAYTRLELHDEARPLAEAWVAERKPYGDSALGYYVLAAARLRAEQPREALETALRPVVFSAGLPMDYLPHCYAAAIGAALELRERDYARTLFEEMYARQLPWPDDPQFESYPEALNPNTK